MRGWRVWVGQCDYCGVNPPVIEGYGHDEHYLVCRDCAVGELETERAFLAQLDSDDMLRAGSLKLIADLEALL